ncbi:MAG: hypothetical protein HY788_10455 [Deltaproteobacteria bacterium]|nr:hypothetical protein [Deltaproteobacteria bacterium]
MIRLRSSDHGIMNRVVSGGGVSLICFLLSGLILCVFLFNTVHKRDYREYAAAKDQRNHNLIQRWIDEGYFKQGGMLILPEKDAEGRTVVYSSSFFGFLQAGHLLERLNRWLRGTYSYRLMAWHNQAVVWLTSALLAWLAMRLALRMGVEPFSCLLLGIGCQFVHQTFGPNLWLVWNMTSQAVLVLFVVLFLLFEEAGLDRTDISKYACFGRALAVFGMMYATWMAGLLFLFSYFGTVTLLHPSRLRSQRLFWAVLVPMCLVFGIHVCQILVVIHNFPDARFVGGTFLYRSGLDGATNHFLSHMDILTNKRRSLPYLQWKVFLYAGTLVLFALIPVFVKLREGRIPVTIILMLTGMYIPWAFVFSQSWSVHPHLYDVMLFPALVLATFSVFPAFLERMGGNQRIIVLVTIGVAFCYSFVQLRDYAASFPLTIPEPDWKLYLPR